MSKRKTVTERALEHPVVIDQMDWVFRLLTTAFSPTKNCKALRSEIQAFAKKAATLVLATPGTSPDLSTIKAKSRFNSLVSRRILEKDVQELVTETRKRLSLRFPKLVKDHGEITEQELSKAAFYASAFSLLILHGQAEHMPEQLGLYTTVERLSIVGAISGTKVVVVTG